MTVGSDPLYDAIRRGDFTAARTAIDEATDIASRRFRGKSYLRMACECGNVPIAKLLLHRGADINERDGARKYTLLYHAVATKDYGFANCLLELGAAPSAINSSNATPLHFAARDGLAYLARKLINYGAAVNAQDSQGRTPLFLAASKGNLEITALLLASNADASRTDQRGRTAMCVAMIHGHKEVVALLGVPSELGYLGRVAESRDNDGHSRG